MPIYGTSSQFLVAALAKRFGLRPPRSSRESQIAYSCRPGPLVEAHVCKLTQTWFFPLETRDVNQQQVANGLD